MLSTRRIGAVAVAVASALVLAAGPASAHTEVQSTYPGSGKAVRANQVSWVSVTFKSPIRGGAIKVTGPGGRAYNRGRAERDPRNERRLRVRVRALRSGAYTATWTMRHTDGHTIRGSFGFRVS